MTVDNTQEVIDSRDVIARIEELNPFRVDRVNAQDDSDLNLAEFKTRKEAEQFIEEEDYDPARVVITEIDDESDELRDLQRLAEQGEDSPDWDYGETLIRFDYFEQYCKEMVEDLQYLPRDLPDFIRNNIDWEGVANVLAGDYAEVDFAGVTYLIRS